MKKRPKATQTLRDGCSKADPQTNQHTDTDDYIHCAATSLARSLRVQVGQQRQCYPAANGHVQKLRVNRVPHHSHTRHCDR